MKLCGAARILRRSSPILAQKNKNRRAIVTFEQLTAILIFYGIARRICATSRLLARVGKLRRYTIRNVSIQFEF